MKRVWFGNGTKVAGEEVLYRQNPLPVAKGERDLSALFVGPDVIGGLREMMVQEIKDLGQPGGLCWGKLLRQGREQCPADVHVAVVNRHFFLDVQIELAIGGELRCDTTSVHGGWTLLLVAHLSHHAAQKRMEGATNRGAALVDLFVGAKKQKRPAQGNAITEPKPANLYDVTVDACTVGAFEIGQNQVAAILLNLGVKATNTVVIQAKKIAFFPANRERHRQISENPSLIDAIQHLEGHAQIGARRHRRILHCGPLAGR